MPGHSGHRQRVKTEFLARGVEGWSDHRILELLLFYAIPQGDVNELAHRLVDNFGSLAGVLDASAEELKKVPGVGEHTAVLLKLVPALGGRYQEQRGAPGQIIHSPEEAAAVLENAALLEQYGFGVEDFGDGTVLLRRVPADIAPEDAGAGLAELAGHLLEGRTLAPESLRDELLHTVACKAAIKAGYHTQPREREALVREVLTRDDLKYCPHGRPICITLTQKQLEKQFKRI